MNTDPIVIHGPSYGALAATVIAGMVLAGAAAAVATWLVIGAPLPANRPGPWWSWRTIRAVVAHTLGRARRLHDNQPPPPLDDAPTVHLNVPLSVPRPRRGDHDDDH